MGGMKPELYDAAPEFRPWGKTPRFNALHAVVTEKLDGTNALIHITDDGVLYPGSRNRWIQPGKKTDNYGFAQWCEDNHDELMKLGAGWHYGEWWGYGIGRGYGMKSPEHFNHTPGLAAIAGPQRILSLFNTKRWGAHNPNTPACVSVVPTLYDGPFDLAAIYKQVAHLQATGSVAAPGFMDIEGVVAYLPQFDQRMKIVVDKKGPSPIEAV